MDSEKVFDLIEKMYFEMQKGFTEVRKDIKDLKDGQLKLEDKLEETRKTLYDGYIQNSEAIKRMEMKLKELSDKVDKHDIKIQVIEGGKKAL